MVDLLARQGGCAGSLLTALYGTARSVPRRIACHLADVLQMQCAVTGCIRQISLIEAEAYALLCKHKDDPETVIGAVAECQRAIDVAVERTVVLIERYTDPDRERKPPGKRVTSERQRRSATLGASSAQ